MKEINLCDHINDKEKNLSKFVVHSRFSKTVTTTTTKKRTIRKLRVEMNFLGLTKGAFKILLISILLGELLKAFPLKLRMKQNAYNSLLYLALYWRN